MNPKIQHFLNASVAAFIGWLLWDILPKNLAFIPYTLFGVSSFSFYRLVRPSKAEKIFISGFGLSWTKDQFCRGWSIQGSTGQGKTSAALVWIAHSLFKNSPNWGGLILDPKCVLWIDFKDIAKTYGRSEDFINLQIRPADAPENWKPAQTINLLSYPFITVKTYAKIVVDTAVALSGSDSNPFFKVQAERNIEMAMRALKTAGLPVTLARIFRIYTSDNEIKRAIERLKRPTVLDSLPLLQKHCPDIHQVLVDAGITAKTATLEAKAADNPDITFNPNEVAIDHNELANLLCEPSEDAAGLVLLIWKSIPDELIPESKTVLDHFEQLLITGLDQKSGVMGTLVNYLRFFDQPDINEIVCSENPTISFEQIDQGKFLCFSIPQKYGAERDYLFTFTKLLSYTHALGRFDYKHDRKRWNSKNLLVSIFDEAQGVATAAEDGMADYNTLDKIREAECTAIFAAQSTTSYLPRLKLADKTKVMLLNLKNQISFQIADMDAAKLLADTIGKTRIWKTSHSSNPREASSSRQQADEYRMRPEQLMQLSQNEAIIRHATGKWIRYVMPPLDEKGEISSRYLENLYQ